jgi:putative endonuclease
MLFNKTSYTVGLYSEFLARMYLRFHGYRILKSRYITGKNTNRAEIDIIAKRKDTIVFVEVKARQNISAAWDAITPTQSARLRRAAETYLINKRWTGNARFDVIVVCGHKIYWAKNAI